MPEYREDKTCNSNLKLAAPRSSFIHGAIREKRSPYNGSAAALGAPLLHQLATIPPAYKRRPSPSHHRDIHSSPRRCPAASARRRTSILHHAGALLHPHAATPFHSLLHTQHTTPPAGGRRDLVSAAGDPRAVPCSSPPGTVAAHCNIDTTMAAHVEGEVLYMIQ